MEEGSEIPKEYLTSLRFPEEKTQIAVSTIGKERVQSLQETIQEIHTMIESRNTLSQEFLKQGEKMKLEINNFLRESAPLGEDDSEFARERAELRKKLIEIGESQQKEKINCWKDIAELKQELRQQQKELQEKEARAEMIEKILEEKE